MNFYPITFIPTPFAHTNEKINPDNYELIINHNYVMYLDASNYYRCKATGNIYRISFRYNNIYPGPHETIR